MSTLLVLLLCSSIIQAVTGSDNVHCYANVNEKTGECEDYLGEGVSDTDCCLNIKYGFKEDGSSACQACRQPEWTEWGAWSGCTVSCLEGVQERRRLCIGQGDCPGNDLEVQACTLQECCPQIGGWSEWSAWSECSVTCESGQRKRTRECNNPLPICGGRCIGNGVETIPCDTHQVCPTHGSWGNWGSWQQCSSACIREGSGVFPVQSRFRQCSNPPPSQSPPGRPCDGNNQENRNCLELPFCSVNGEWGAWQPDSECSVTCGVGRIRQKRSCNNPAPRHGGKACVGSPTKQTICNTKLQCPIDGYWSEWTEWSKCSSLSYPGFEHRCKEKAGTQKRERDCLGVTEDPPGKWCDGDYRESRYCYYMDRCILPGVWTEWSEWGLCSSSCGKSERSRTRECKPTYPDFSMVVAGAVKVVDVFFSGKPTPKCDPINNQRFKVTETINCKNVPECT
ncbi:properdin-like [Leptodactylus fuscus]|uniref:properdin-like n=1 Tax=Leptodactylus fuscus TaxID=238119 RepID=UPI003F4EF89B